MRTATIHIRKPEQAVNDVRAGFLATWRSEAYGGEHFDFESPAALERDVKRVHEDAATLIATGLVEKTTDGKLMVPFVEIRADFMLRAAA